VFGKSAVLLGAQLGAQALERAIPGRPSSNETKAGSATGLPSRPFVLPSILGGGTYQPTTGNVLIFLVIGIVVFFGILTFAGRRR